MPGATARPRRREWPWVEPESKPAGSRQAMRRPIRHPSWRDLRWHPIPLQPWWPACPSGAPVSQRNLRDSRFGPAGCRPPRPASQGVHPPARTGDFRHPGGHLAKRAQWSAGATQPVRSPPDPVARQACFPRPVAAPKQQARALPRGVTYEICTPLLRKASYIVYIRRRRTTLLM